MPFTPAHTAIVLPFLRYRHASATALVIGSMAPDFEYFFKLSVDGVHGHTWAGLLYFDLPVTIFLGIVYHRLVKRNLIENLPGVIQRRLSFGINFDFWAACLRRPVPVALSAVAGSASHILWDGFTHGSGFFVSYFSFYDGAYVPFEGVDYPLWYALQYISTFAGLTIVAFYVALLPEGVMLENPRWSYWVILVAVTSSVVAIRFLVYSAVYNLGNLVVSGISGLCVGLMAGGMLGRVGRKYQ